jgi:sterol desaturase/sphingolipid hydroxylase (fatty acid hydroxylase superfamily)
MDFSALMADWLLQHEPGLRLGVFLGLFAALAWLEWRYPRRAETARHGRWLTNITLLAIDGLVLRLFFPLLAVGAAVWAQAAGVGLFNVWALPGPLAFVGCLLLLDLAIWAQHLLMHKVPLLWRLHRVHHCDLAFDVTTGIRFHPLEIALSMALKMALVVALGAPVAAVVVFEVLLNATSLFNHANLRLPASLDRVLRWLVVTPDMHRVHHSVYRPETDSNYGFNLPWWDRLFGTYRAQPRDGHEAMRIGLEEFRSPREQTLRLLLIQPFGGSRQNASRSRPVERSPS